MRIMIFPSWGVILLASLITTTDFGFDGSVTVSARRIFRHPILPPLSVYIADNRAAAATAVRNKNGVRLTLDSGPRGRLEISTNDPLFPGTNAGSKTVWLPVCSEGFTDGEAETMCQLLGYKSGRTYYTDVVANSPIPSNGVAARYVNCKPYPNRRLRGISSIDKANDRTSNQIHARSLSYREYSVGIPRRASLMCGFFIGLCAPQGPFAGIQCTDNALPAAPTSSPSPSLPPYEDYVRLVGGNLPSGFRSVESNLCPPSHEELCRNYGRLELRVSAPNGESGDVWAPLCSVESSNDTKSAAALRTTIVNVACQQAYGWPSLRPMPTRIVSGLLPVQEPLAFQVPQAASVGGSTFNPVAVSAWVTITSHPGNTPSMLQDGSLTVSTQPCKSLFAIQCALLDLRRQ
ncbi:hypothetical protein VaNZ11_007911 [Volvox africanus]|uniref:SRCR domain-containing protein n=1 Tax=Volvox africanus TaxID=51714 RepID=A0ABQ5S483_9CHLO|nr:hypothetical protein VaNZ11_007911 [Volvox africanus]